MKTTALVIVAICALIVAMAVFFLRDPNITSGPRAGARDCLASPAHICTQNERP